MYLADLGNDALSGYVIKLIQDKVKTELLEYKHLLDELYQRYSEEDIKRAIDLGISRVGNKVYMQTDNLNGEILRFIEYGTGRTKPLQLVTKAVRFIMGGRV
ncbi:MAG: hypothetical protein J6T15_05065 [Bacilli bacterium]|nr:hypothetical protein [Bacilli bacterium]